MLYPLLLYSSPLATKELMLPAHMHALWRPGNRPCMTAMAMTKFDSMTTMSMTAMAKTKFDAKTAMAMTNSNNCTCHLIKKHHKALKPLPKLWLKLLA